MVKACCITVLEWKYVAKVFWGWRQLLLSFRIKGYVEMGFYAKGMSLWLHVANHIRLIAIWCKWLLRLKTCCKGFYGWRHVLGYFVSNTCVFTQLGEKQCTMSCEELFKEMTHLTQTLFKLQRDCFWATDTITNYVIIKLWATNKITIIYYLEIWYTIKRQSNNTKWEISHTPCFIIFHNIIHISSHN